MRTITIDTNAEKTLQRVYDEKNPGFDNYAFVVSPKCAVTYNELLKRLTASAFEPIELTMKCGDKILITPCAWGNELNTLSDIEYFLVESERLPYMGQNSLIEVAAELCDYESLIAKQEDEKSRCRKFFEEHIKGHTSEQLNLGNKLAINFCQRQPEITREEYLEEMADRTGKSYEMLSNAMSFSDDLSFYSDWHKDLYGFRPRSLN